MCKFCTNSLYYRVKMLNFAKMNTRMNRELIIPLGGMYQEWDCLIDLLEQDKAKELEELALSGCWREVQPCEAENMGFGELVEWSMHETDVLVLINENYLVCIPKKLYFAEC